MPDAGDPLPITPDTKVGEMLERYPHLEEVLIGLSPAYKALRNPVLRRTVAKVAALRQVSAVGNVPLGRLIETLRTAAGQHPLEGGTPEAPEPAGERPGWACLPAADRTFDARPVIEAGGHPMPQVMRDLSELKPGEVYALVTPFVPAPLVDLAQERGFATWSAREGPEFVRTFIRKPPDEV